MIIIKGSPISVNKLYRGRRFLTNEGKGVKEGYAWDIKTQWKKPITNEDVAVNIMFYFSNNRSDIDNCLKAILDAGTGIIWNDDKQITEMHIFKEIDKDNPRTEMSII